MTIPSTMTGEEAEESKGVMTDALHERVEAHEDLASIAQWVDLDSLSSTYLTVFGLRKTTTS